MVWRVCGCLFVIAKASVSCLGHSERRPRTARPLFPHSIPSTSHRQQLCPLPLYSPLLMATKAAYKRVRMLHLLLLGTIHQCSPTPALKGVCYHAEGATPFRLGCPRRERHPDLCVLLLSRHGPDTHTPLSREFYHRKGLSRCDCGTWRLTHHPSLSTVHQIPPT